MFSIIFQFDINWILLQKEFISMNDRQEFLRSFEQIDRQEFDSRFTNGGQILGFGSSAFVYKSVDKSTEKTVAIKMFKKSLISSMMTELMREISLLKRLQQIQKDYFAQFYHAFMITQQNSYREQYCLVLECCKNSLLDQIQNNKNLQMKERFAFIEQISLGVKKLHDNQILHRDLKPENILITYRNGRRMAVIVDFGHSKLHEIENTSHRGSPLYDDPYLFETRDYSYNWDIYALGITIVEIITGSFLIKLTPEEQQDQDKFFSLMKNALSNISKRLKENKKIPIYSHNLIEGCLRRNKRFTIQDVLKEIKKIQNQQFQDKPIISKQMKNLELRINTNERNLQQKKEIVQQSHVSHHEREIEHAREERAKIQEERKQQEDKTQIGEDNSNNMIDFSEKQLMKEQDIEVQEIGKDIKQSSSSDSRKTLSEIVMSHSQTKNEKIVITKSVEASTKNKGETSSPSKISNQSFIEEQKQLLIKRKNLVSETAWLAMCLSENLNKIKKIQQIRAIDLDSWQKKQLILFGFLFWMTQITQVVNFSSLHKENSKMFASYIMYLNSMVEGPKKEIINELPLNAKEILNSYALDNHDIKIMYENLVFNCGGDPYTKQKLKEFIQ